MENDLKGNKNCLELAGGSSYTEGSSYWESTVIHLVIRVCQHLQSFPLACPA